MKKLVSIIVVLIFCNVGFAQNAGYKKGDKLLNIGLGVNSYYNGGIPFGASFEVGITEDISVGGNFDYLSYSYKYSGNLSNRFSTFYIGARGSYHLNRVFKISNEKVDLFVGAILGFRSFSWNDDNYAGNGLESYGSGLYLGGFIGGKYYFSDKVCVFTELGAIGSTNARIGVGFKL